MPNQVLPRIALPDIAGAAAAGPAAILAEIRRSLGTTAASIEASLPGRATSVMPRGTRTPREFIRGLQVQVERATGITMPRLPGAPREEPGREEAPLPAPRKAPKLVFE